MILIIGLAIFLFGCLLSAVSSDSREADLKAEKRNRELMESLKREKPSSQPKHVSIRRIIKDSEGNVIGEEVIEEY